MKTPMIVVASALALPLASCMAQEEPRPARTAASAGQCFNVESVTGFSPVDRDTVDVRIGAARAYRLELSGGCEDIDWASGLAIRSRTGRLACSHCEVDLIVPSSIGPGRCFATSMRQLSPAEIQPRSPRR
jgi:hypothetical protein